MSHNQRIDSAPEPLAQLLAEREIHRRLTDYCRGVDRCDQDLVASVYHPGATDDHGSFVGTGHDFAGYVVQRMRESHVATMHTLGNITIDFSGPDHAVVESYVHAEQCRVDADGPFIEYFGGRYVDRFERRDGAWRIAHRTLLHEWDRLERITPAFPAGKFRSGRRDRHDPSYGGREIAD